MLRDCLDSNLFPIGGNMVGDGIQEFVDCIDGTAFLERKLVRFGVSRCQ